jgi:hypothetical protein
LLSGRVGWGREGSKDRRRGAGGPIHFRRPLEGHLGMCAGTLASMRKRTVFCTIGCVWGGMLITSLLIPHSKLSSLGPCAGPLCQPLFSFTVFKQAFYLMKHLLSAYLMNQHAYSLSIIPILILLPHMSSMGIIRHLSTLPPSLT